MDHLPHPRNLRGSTTLLQVPFLPHKPDYDTSKGHRFFPQNHKYIAGREYPDRTAYDVASFVQSFLYFGLLSDALGYALEPIELTKTEISEDGNTELKLSSDKLKILILNYQEQLTSKGQQEGQRLLRLLESAKANLQQIERILHPTGDPLPIVLLSVGVLIETLFTVYFNNYSLGPNYAMLPRPLVNGDIQTPASARLLEFQMKENGWCPTHIRHTLSSFSYSTNYYISQIRRYPPTHSPSPTPMRRSHISCSVDSCVAYDTDPKTYQTAHYGDCGDCQTIKTPLDKLAKLVGEGKIPLIGITRGLGGEISLTVKESTIDDNYIAVSHVWADGMGNQVTNGLPKCQLERIAKYISELPPPPTRALFQGPMTRQRANLFYGPKLFWLDTLCIPHDPHLRKLAINAIPAVYSGATQVLVLDSEIEMVPKDSSWPEIASRLVFSAWSSRSWTLEEAGFSRACRVKVAGGFFDPEASGQHSSLENTKLTSLDLWESLRRLARSIREDLYYWVKPDKRRRLADNFDKQLMMMVCEPLETFFSEMFARGSSQEEEFEQVQSIRKFAFVWNSLAGRQTSVEEDKLTILVHMLDLNPFEIMGAPSARARRPAKIVTEQTLLLGESSAQQQQQPSAELNWELAMKKILMSNEYLPQALLYNAGNRARPNEDHDFRWLPVYPSTARLDLKSVLIWKDDGLCFDYETDEGPSGSFKLFKFDRNIANVSQLVLASTSKFLRKKDWIVQFMRSPDDKMNKGRFSLAAIVFEYSEGIDNTERRGACLLVSEIYSDCSCPEDEEFGLVPAHVPDCEYRKLRLRCTYDCPVRVRPYIQSEAILDAPVKIPSQSVGQWEVVLKCGEFKTCVLPPLEVSAA
ncbi:hypothetical protein ABW20_dc0101274 [Dactylellina cionopaga]|nr:hypothetical protein ABW20_dc0101274 [Dactylellina cionopaga]